MKKILVPVLALFLLLVPIHSLNAGTNQACHSQVTRLVVNCHINPAIILKLIPPHIEPLALNFAD